MRKGPLLGPTVPLWLLLLGVTAAIPFADALAADKTAPPSAAGTYVIVARAVQGCFFDTVRVSGYLMPRQEMQIPFEAEGYRITEVSVEYPERQRAAYPRENPGRGYDHKNVRRNRLDRLAARRAVVPHCR